MDLISKKTFNSRVCEIGYWVGAPFWGRGLATKALMLLTKYAFGALDKMRVYTSVFEYNKASIRVLEKCGCQTEGVFLKDLTKDGKFYNEVRYARLR